MHSQDLFDINDFDFNKSSTIEFGKDWPKFNNQQCYCELSENYAIKLCSFHQLYSASGEVLRFAKESESFETKCLHPSINNSYSNDTLQNEFNPNAVNTANKVHHDEVHIQDLEVSHINENNSFKLENDSSNSLINANDEESVSVVNYNEHDSEYVSKTKEANNKEEHHYTRYHKNKSANGIINVRYDVMNKNFIRVVKRELKKLLDQFLKIQVCANLKNSYEDNNEIFAQYLLNNTSIQWCEIEGFDVKNFIAYLMALTKYCQFKNMRNKTNERTIMNQVYNLLYSYSHNRFYNFIKIPEVNVLIQILEEKHGINGLIELISSSSKESYENHIGSLLASICKHNL